MCLSYDDEGEEEVLAAFDDDAELPLVPLEEPDDDEPESFEAEVDAGAELFEPDRESVR